MLTPSGTREARYKVGAIVGGKYHIKRLLGHGGMGSVYKAENTTIGRTVAVKILHPHLADDGVTLARFQREARAAAGIASVRATRAVAACKSVLRVVMDMSFQAS